MSVPPLIPNGRWTVHTYYNFTVKTLNIGHPRLLKCCPIFGGFGLYEVCSLFLKKMSPI